MNNALEIKGLCKSYPKFQLTDVSFNVPAGSITGFIGRNGAGKTTTLKSIMNLLHYDKGEVKVFDQDMLKNELALKQDIAFSLSEINYYPNATIKKLTKVTSKFYNNFSYDTFNKLCERFNLDPTKRLEQLSSGMKVKYSLAIALSHDAKLLILDEPTSGLDPVSRGEITDLFIDLVKDGKRSILFSTHITSDLDKCADHIVYIENGKITFTGKKEDLVNKYALLRCEYSAITDKLKEKFISSKEQFGQVLALVKKEDVVKKKGIKVLEPSIEDIMQYGEQGANYEKITL
ncbi:MAG: ABC transporter ATP-binding protein [Bacilli bacterium]|nr:ABC transporter ATP-binding protein [Bacilli bacterium]